jgi:hypothetical protein
MGKWGWVSGAAPAANAFNWLSRRRVPQAGGRRAPCVDGRHMHICCSTVIVSFTACPIASVGSASE